MVDVQAHKIISDALEYFGVDSEDAANAVVGALAVAGFAIVRVDAEDVRRVIAQTSNSRDAKS